MAKRKTIEVAKIKEMVNERLAKSVDNTCTHCNEIIYFNGKVWLSFKTQSEFCVLKELPTVPYRHEDSNKYAGPYLFIDMVQSRNTMASVLEAILMETGNYKGFGYQKGVVQHHSCPDSRAVENDPWTCVCGESLKPQFVGDESRRIYY